MKKKSDFNWGNENVSERSNSKIILSWFSIIIIVGAFALFFNKKTPETKNNVSNKIASTTGSISKKHIIYTTIVGPFKNNKDLIKFALKYKKENYPVEYIEDEMFIQIGKYYQKSFAIEFSNKLKENGYFCKVDKWINGKEIRINNINKKVSIKKPKKDLLVSNKKIIKKQTYIIKKNKPKIKLIPKYSINKKKIIINNNIDNKTSKNKLVKKETKKQKDPIANIISKNEEKKQKIQTKTINNIVKNNKKTIIKPIKKKLTTIKKASKDPIEKIISKNEEKKNTFKKIKSISEKKEKKLLSSYFTIQIGAYYTRKDAENTIKKLPKLSIKPVVFTINHKYKYRIQYGIFKTKEECYNSKLRKEIIDNNIPEFISFRKL